MSVRRTYSDNASSLDYLLGRRMILFLLAPLSLGTFTGVAKSTFPQIPSPIFVTLDRRPSLGPPRDIPEYNQGKIHTGVLSTNVEVETQFTDII